MSISMATISVVIPCFNSSRTISRALVSVYSQTLVPTEVIVVNDCSDDTQELELCLKAFPEVIYISNPINVGCAGSRNIGAFRATSELVAFLDADDEFHPLKLELQAPITYTGLVSTTSLLRPCRPTSVDPHDLPSINPSHYLFFESAQSLFFAHQLTGASLMISRSDFLSLNGFDESLRNCEDLEFWFRVSNKGLPIVLLNLPLYSYYHSFGGTSSDLASNYLAQSSVYSTYQKQIPSFPVNLFFFVAHSLRGLKYVAHRRAGLSLAVLFGVAAQFGPIGNFLMRTIYVIGYLPVFIVSRVLLNKKAA